MPGLSYAAQNVLAKISSILPEQLRPVIDDPAVTTPSPYSLDKTTIDLAQARQWCREGRKLLIQYVDSTGQTTERTIWPVIIGYVAESKAVIAWCELRDDFRIFLAERIISAHFLNDLYPEHPTVLRRRWLEQSAIKKPKRR